MTLKVIRVLWSRCINSMSPRTAATWAWTSMTTKHFWAKFTLHMAELLYEKGLQSLAFKVNLNAKKKYNWSLKLWLRRSLSFTSTVILGFLDEANIFIRQMSRLNVNAKWLSLKAISVRDFTKEKTIWGAKTSLV